MVLRLECSRRIGVALASPSHSGRNQVALDEGNPVAHARHASTWSLRTTKQACFDRSSTVLVSVEATQQFHTGLARARRRRPGGRLFPVIYAGQLIVRLRGRAMVGSQDPRTAVATVVSPIVLCRARGTAAPGACGCRGVCMTR